MYRIGFGYDIHQLVEGREFWLGGVNIPHSKGPKGHSDADVLIHALCDALLGASNQRDIGFHFPDTDKKFKNADSKILLAEVVKLLDKANYTFVNADCTVCVERPKLMPYVERMKSELSKIIGCTIDDISIKATRGEKMGFVGREEGLKAYATVLIKRKG